MEAKTDTSKLSLSSILSTSSSRKNPVLKIIMDDREPLLIKEILEKRGVIVVRSRLDVGDYIISSRVAIERKAGSDYSLSLVDERLFDNLKRLKDTYEIAILLLEDFQKTMLKTHLPHASIYGSLAFLAYRMGIIVIPTIKKIGTVDIVERFAFQTQVEQKEHLFSRKAPKGMTAEERKAYFLEGLISSGPVMANKLLENFDNPLDVLHAIKETEVIYSKSGKPKKLKGPLDNIAGVGPKFVMKNKELLS